MNALAPFVVRKSDNRDVLDQWMRAHQSLDLRRINVLAAGNDHVALAVRQMNAALRITSGHVADRAIVAAKRLFGFLRYPPIAVGGVSIAGEQPAGFTVRYLVARFVKELYRRCANALAADRTELCELFVR